MGTFCRFAWAASAPIIKNSPQTAEKALATVG
jgi:hypothetical protein